MALEDFYGRYEVEVTGGMQFGVGAEVQIDEAEADRAKMTFRPLNVDFTPSNNGQQTLEAIYDSLADCLVVDLDETDGLAQTMHVSRFVDPKSEDQNIYSFVLMKSKPGVPILTPSPVWAAKRTSSTVGSTVDRPLSTEQQEPRDFVGKYQLRTTADAQFGKGSTIEISSENGSHGLLIYNANMKLVGGSDSLAWDADTVTLVGDLQTETLVPVTVSLSLAVDGDGNKRLYGNVVVADPEQGGTFAGQEEDPGDITIEPL